MPVTRSLKKKRLALAVHERELYTKGKPPRVGNGIALARAVVLVAILGTAIWYLLWRIAAHVWLKR
jgi:hypothetical protein